MTPEEKQLIMDSLTADQRKGIAAIVRGADVAGNYYVNDNNDSAWGEDASATLESLAAYFEDYDPESALE